MSYYLGVQLHLFSACGLLWYIIVAHSVGLAADGSAVVGTSNLSSPRVGRVYGELERKDIDDLPSHLLSRCSAASFLCLWSAMVHHGCPLCGLGSWWFSCCWNFKSFLTHLSPICVIGVGLKQEKPSCWRDFVAGEKSRLFQKLWKGSCCSEYAVFDWFGQAREKQGRTDLLQVNLHSAMAQPTPPPSCQFSILTKKLEESCSASSHASQIQGPMVRSWMCWQWKSM